MAMSWNPLDRPMHRVSADRAIGEEGSVVQFSETGGEHAPRHDENYDATDGRHNRADHQGWISVDPMGGPTSETDFAEHAGRFPDGPGPWRQT